MYDRKYRDATVRGRADATAQGKTRAINIIIDIIIMISKCVIETAQYEDEQTRLRKVNYIYFFNGCYLLLFGARVT